MREWLERIAGLKVLVIGDAIRDVYEYVVPFGKGSKEPILAVRRVMGSQEFKGGAWAVYRQVVAFASRAFLYSGSNCIVKTRLLDFETKRKLFEIHEDEEDLVDSGDMPTNFADLDAVIVADFGHGLMTEERIGRLQAGANWLAVNTQTNSANFGFNLITKYAKYPFTHLIVLDELEARLAVGNQHGPIERVIHAHGRDRMIVTLGSKGAIGWDGKRYHREPAFTHHIVDTMGAGDAFFVVAALFARAGAPMDVVLKVGNAAGAVKCGILGHERSVMPEDVLAYLNER